VCVNFCFDDINGDRVHDTIRTDEPMTVGEVLDEVDERVHEINDMTLTKVLPPTRLPGEPFPAHSASFLSWIQMMRGGGGDTVEEETDDGETDDEWTDDGETDDEETEGGETDGVAATADSGAQTLSHKD